MLWQKKKSTIPRYLQKQAEKNILRYEGAAQDPRQLIDRIQEIDCQTSSLLFLVARSEDTSIYEGKFKALKEEKQALQTELESLQRTSQMDAKVQNRIQKVLGCIQSTPADFTQYDDDLVRRIVEQVIVYSQEKVVVKFVGGYSVEMVTGNWEHKNRQARLVTIKDLMEN